MDVSEPDLSHASGLPRLAEIMARLRDRHAGCKWDIAQTFETIAPYTIEEAYEVADAIRRGDMESLKDELGDLLFAVVNYARHLDINPETALREATARFESRFRKVEEIAARPLNQMNIDELEALWQRAKKLV